MNTRQCPFALHVRVYRALLPMKIEYRGHTIDVRVTGQLVGWSEKVLIWPVVETIIALREQHEVEGYKNQEEAAEAACNGVGSDSIYTPNINFVSFKLHGARVPSPKNERAPNPETIVSE